MPNFEQPQQSNTPPSADELLEKARAKEQARKSADIGTEKAEPKTSEVVSTEVPTSMDDLLKGLQEEVKETEEIKKDVVEVPKDDSADIGKDNISENYDPVKTELEKKYADLGDKYSEGHKKFGDKWTSTPEFQALGRESSLFQQEYQSKGFTLENGVIKPIDKEKLERERQIEEINESSRKLRTKSSVMTGRDAHAILSGNTESYKTAVEYELQSTIALEENMLKSKTLEFAGRDQDSPLDRTTHTTIREALSGLKSGVEDRIAALKKQLEQLNDPKEVEDMIKRDKERLKDGGQVYHGDTYLGPASINKFGKRIEDPNGLIRALTEGVDNVFDHRKGLYDIGVARALDFGDYPWEGAQVLKGVGLAALEAGDIKTAAQAIAFSELINPMSPEEMKEMVGAISKLSPDKKREFVMEMDAEKKRPHREYKKEVETRSEKPIMSMGR